MTTSTAELELRLAALQERRDKIAALRAQLEPELQDHQRPPDGDWLVWCMRAGRGSGKTFAGMHWLNKQAESITKLRARIIAPTLADGVASCVEGPDGLLQASQGTATFRASAPGGAVVEYPNGSKVWIVGTPTPKDVDRLRALTNIEIDVFEEAFANPRFQEAWDQAELSRRRGNPRAVVTSTPRPHKIWKIWESDPEVVITKARTSDNKKADPRWVARQERKYKGTRLYKQEILGEVLEDVEGALWKQRDIDRSLFVGDRQALVDAMDKIAVGVDPPSGSGTCGIVVVGRIPSGTDSNFQPGLYVLADYSLTDVTPNRWALQVGVAASDYNAAVVAEINQGGQMVVEVLQAANFTLGVNTVNAAKSKEARAEPYALMWEAEYQTAFMAPETDLADFADLIDQLTTWVPKSGMDSPDRLDGLVWACKYLDEDSGSAELVTTGTNPVVPSGTSLSALRMGRF